MELEQDLELAKEEAGDKAGGRQSPGGWQCYVTDRLLSATKGIVLCLNCTGAT